MQINTNTASSIENICILIGELYKWQLWPLRYVVLHIDTAMLKIKIAT